MHWYYKIVFNNCFDLIAIEWLILSFYIQLLAAFLKILVFNFIILIQMEEHVINKLSSLIAP